MCIVEYIFIETVFSIRTARNEDETVIYREQDAKNRGEILALSNPEAQRDLHEYFEAWFEFVAQKSCQPSRITTFLCLSEQQAQKSYEVQKMARR